MIKLNVDWRKRWFRRDLREHAIKHGVDINLEKNALKPFSICSNRLEILSKYRIDNNEKIEKLLFVFNYDYKYFFLRL